MASGKQAGITVFLIGIGMGGFIDGIVLHQILQWHNMVSNLIPPTTMEGMRVNMVWDGIFHAVVHPDQMAIEFEAFYNQYQSIIET